MSRLFMLFLVAIITINKAQNDIPQWAKHAVWYQIFPERFNNGDESNDPTKEDLVNIWPYIEPDEWYISPWTSDWYKLQPWEKKLNLNFYQIQGLRRYGGDIQGVIDKLDYLKELGINAIYLNPAFESPSLHKYDASMYRHIDNNFGPNPQHDEQIWNEENPIDPATWQWTTADSLFLNLVDQCHKRNMKIIIDGVFNHVGKKFWAFKDVVENQELSKYKNWFTIISWDDPTTDSIEFDYAGWYGVKDLPEIRENDAGLIPEFKEHIKNIVQRWMDPNNDGNPSDGIDGWRLDVAEMVNIKFWKEFRKWVKEINPDAYLTGEVWWEDWGNNKMFNASPWLGDAFDAVMNYRFARAIKHFVVNKENKINSESFIDTLKNIYSDYDWEHVQVLQNLLDSHDVDRIGSQLMNPDLIYDHDVSASQNKDYNIGKPDKTALMKWKLIVALQMTLPGAPMIYYGDEAGMWGGDDPDCRKPMVWSDRTYEVETTHPFKQTGRRDTIEFNRDLFEWYRNLISIRTENPVLSDGLIILDSINKNLLWYRRFNSESEIVVVANNSNAVEYVDFDQFNLIFAGMNYTELITGENYNLNEIRILKLLPFQTLILKRVGEN